MGSRAGFTEDENAFLRAAWPDKAQTIANLQLALDRSRSGIQGQARRLNLGPKPHNKVNPHGKSWTAEREAVLRGLANGQKSWRAIALEMGVSKNTVLCKAIRLGLHTKVGRQLKRQTTVKPKIQTYGHDKGREAKPSQGRKDAFLPLLGSSPRLWTEREPGQCKWPVGGEGADMLMCCQRASNNRYCASHEAMATRQSQPSSAPQNYIRRRAA